MLGELSSRTLISSRNVILTSLRTEISFFPLANESKTLANVGTKDSERMGFKPKSLFSNTVSKNKVNSISLRIVRFYKKITWV